MNLSFELLNDVACLPIIGCSIFLGFIVVVVVIITTVITIAAGFFIISASAGCDDLRLLDKVF